MSLVANYSSSDNSSSESLDEEERDSELLPLPTSFAQSEDNASLEKLRERKSTDNSVYSNPYIREQEQSLAVISKHTALTNKPEETAEDRKLKKRKKKIINKPCTQFFKKGSCRYEDECKFLHSFPCNNDNDVNTSNNVNTLDTSYSENLNNCSPVFVSGPNVSDSLKKKNKNVTNIHYINETVEIQNEVCATDDVFWEGKQTVKKKRPGLSDDIIPSKRVMKMYKDLTKT